LVYRALPTRYVQPKKPSFIIITFIKSAESARKSLTLEKMKKLLFILLMTFTFNVLLSAQVWTQLNSGTTNALTDVNFINANTGLVCGKSGLVLKTSDGGLTWLSKNSGTTNDLACINFLDLNTGYASGGFSSNSSQNCRLIKTTDGGESWSNIVVSPTGCGGGSYFLDSKIGFYAYADSLYKPSVIAKTVDGGQNWTIVYSASGWVSYFHFVDNLNGYATVNNGTVLKTTDGGQTWNPIALPDKIWVSGVYFLTKDIGFVGGGPPNSPRVIFKTTNGGLSWTSISATNMIFKIDFGSSLLGFALTVDLTGAGHLIKTIDGGDNWITESIPVENLRGINFLGSTLGYAVGDNGVILKYSLSSGISENSYLDNAFSVYPNPASDAFTLDTNFKGENIFQIRIFDISGHLKYSKMIKSSTDKIDVGRLAVGSYILNIQSNTTDVNRKLLIKR
jgi:photosystem II stability/assembly factor-like uncharacterized protein